jgi:hypothetical protein
MQIEVQEHEVEIRRTRNTSIKLRVPLKHEKPMEFPDVEGPSSSLSPMDGKTISSMF